MNQSDLRPLSIGELLDRTFTLYKRHFWLFVALLAPLLAIETVVGSFVQVFTRSEGLMSMTPPGAVAPARGQPTPPAIDPAMFITFVATMTLAGVVMLLRLAISLSATARAANDILHDRIPTTRDFTRLLFTRFGGLVWLMVQTTARVGLAFVLAFGIPVLLATGVGALLGRQSTAAAIFSGVAVLVGMLGAFVVVLVMVLRYALAIPAFVVESLTARQAIRRSIALTRRAMGRTFLVYLVSAIVIWSGQMIATLPFTALVMRDTLRGVLPPLWVVIGSQFAAGVANLALGALSMLPFVLLYYDLRVRKEALDLDMMLASAPPPLAATPGAAARA